MADLLPLAPLPRAKRYKDLGREARIYAARSKDTVRVAFLEIAGHWDALASEAEAASRDSHPTEPASHALCEGPALPDVAAGEADG